MRLLKIKPEIGIVEYSKREHISPIKREYFDGEVFLTDLIKISN